jgi:hypothetical protein
MREKFDKVFVNYVNQSNLQQSQTRTEINSAGLPSTISLLNTNTSNNPSNLINIIEEEGTGSNNPANSTSITASKMEKEI